MPITPFSDNDNSEQLTGFRKEESQRTSGLENAVGGTSLHMPKLNSVSPDHATESTRHFTSKEFNARRFKIRHVSLPR